MARDLVIQKLREVHDELLSIKARGITHVDSADFKAWKQKGEKWLKLGLPHTHDELQKFSSLMFRVLRMRAYGESGYDRADQERYLRDCDQAKVALDSAIENLEMDLVPSPPEDQPSRRRTGKVSRQGSVSISRAENVVLGDGNTVSIVDSITVSDLFKVIEKDLDHRVTDPQEKATLQGHRKELSENPTISGLVTQTLGQLLRGAFG